MSWYIVDRITNIVLIINTLTYKLYELGLQILVMPKNFMPT